MRLRLLKEVKLLKNMEVDEISVVPKGANRKKYILIKSKYALLKGAIPYEKFPLADESTAWDGEQAEKRIQAWASADKSGNKDQIDWGKYRKAFLWYDAKDPESFSSYKMPIIDIIEGEAKVIWRAVVAAHAAMMGARGGVDIPTTDESSVMSRLKSYYEDFGKEWTHKEDNSSFIAPDNVADTAKTGLSLQDEFQRGGSAVEVARANDIMDKRPLSLISISKMASFFSGKFPPAGQEESEALGFWGKQENPSAAYVRWLLYGGDAGKKWAEEIWKNHKGTQDLPALDVINEEERTATGVVLVPDVPDGQGDTIVKEAVRKAAHNFLSKKAVNKSGVYHNGEECSIEIVESYIAPIDMQLGKKTVSQGSWVLTVKIHDDDIWDDVKNGKLTGFSIYGTGFGQEV